MTYIPPEAWLIKRYAKEDDITHVMNRTGCTREVAIENLIAEEGDFLKAIFYIRVDQDQ